MNCIQNILSGNVVIIGIRDYKHCENPVSGLYLNDIEGMSLKTFAAITNEEHESGYKFASDIVLRAVKLVVEDFKQYIFPLYKFDSVVASNETGVFKYPSQWNTKQNIDRVVILTVS